MDILFITEAIIYSDISYRLRVMKLMREASKSARVSLFIFGVASLEGKAGIVEELLANDITLKRSICIPPLPGMRFLGFFFVVVLSWFYLSSLLLPRKGYEVIQVENLLASFLILPFFFVPHRFTVVLDYHGVVPEEVKLKRPRWAWSFFPILKWLERKCIISVEWLIVPSERFRDYANESLGLRREKIVVYPNRVEKNTFRVPAEGRETVRKELEVEDRFVLLYSGNAASYQEPWLMAESFRNIYRAEKRAYFLVLSGSRGEFSALFREAALPEDSFRILRVDHTEVPRYLQVGDLAFLLRDDRLVNQVSSPTKFAEYLACGVPVLTTPWAGDCSAWVERYNIGIVISDLSADAVVEAALNYMGRFTKEGEELRDRCRKFALDVLTTDDGEDSIPGFYDILACKERKNG